MPKRCPSETSNAEGASTHGSHLTFGAEGAKLLSNVTEAEKAQEECKSKWDEINKSISAEATAFHVMTNTDFSNGLGSERSNYHLG